VTRQEGKRLHQVGSTATHGLLESEDGLRAGLASHPAKCVLHQIAHAARHIGLAEEDPAFLNRIGLGVNLLDAIGNVDVGGVIYQHAGIFDSSDHGSGRVDAPYAGFGESLANHGTMLETHWTLAIRLCLSCGRL
jgi:hypothetical protein